MKNYSLLILLWLTVGPFTNFLVTISFVLAFPPLTTISFFYFYFKSTIPTLFGVCLSLFLIELLPRSRFHHSLYNALLPKICILHFFFALSPRCFFPSMGSLKSNTLLLLHLPNSFIATLFHISTSFFR